MEWSPQQDMALEAVRKWLGPGKWVDDNFTGSRQIFRLFGYAGTGKTTLAIEMAKMVDVEVLFGAFTGKAADGAHIVEVPAGVPGPFLLVVHGLHDGPFKVTIVGSFKGAPIYQQALAGTIKKGERLRTEITQQMDPATESEPKTAKVKSGSVVPFSPWHGPLPGTIVLSPLELKAAGGN